MSDAFPTPLPKLGKVGERGESSDLCLCQAISTHTRRGERLSDGKPQISSFPLSCPAVTPIPGAESWPSAAHTCLCWCLCLGSGAVGARQGLLQTTRCEKTIWVWNSSLLQVPCPAQDPTNPAPSPPPLDPSTADSTQRDVKGAGTWHRTPARADVTPNVQAELFYCFLHRPLPPGEAKTSSHRGNELGYSQRKAASSAFPTGNTSSCAQLCPADPPKPIPPSWGSTEGGERRTEGGEKSTAGTTAEAAPAGSSETWNDSWGDFFFVVVSVAGIEAKKGIYPRPRS